MVHGFLNVLKPPGMTSHDVVAWARRLLKTKKIGHGGTLDPDVAGVLPLAVGNGTRLLEYFADGTKAYRAELSFGWTTDTQDASGQILTDAGAVTLDEVEVRRALESFVGQIEQVPPMVSALKIQGKRLYELAREGIEVERPARPVTIHSLTFLQFLPQGPRPRLRFDVVCSKGTYIRTLCHDLGQLLGVGATMTHLIRTKSGPFRLEEALTLEEITEQVDRGINPLQPLATALGQLPLRKVDGEGALALEQGKWLALAPGEGPLGLCQIWREEGELIAVGEVFLHDGRPWLKPKKVLKA